MNPSHRFADTRSLPLSVPTFFLFSLAGLFLPSPTPISAQESATPAFENHSFDARPIHAAIDQAHTVLWTRRMDPHGVLLDNEGEIPKPEDCARSNPNAMGWWTPIENGPMFNGMYLPAICERARRTKAPTDIAKAKRLAAGLMKCASVSDVPGFIARGMGTDGICHYPLGSDDQTHPWFLGLSAYLKSGIPSQAETTEIVNKIKGVADVLQETGWRCPCDGAFKGEFRGGFTGHLFRDAVRYLYLLRTTYEVTREAQWQERYQQALKERPAQSTKTRLEICAAGFGDDVEAIKGLYEHQLWIYVGSQASIAALVAMEKDPAIRAKFESGLQINGQNALKALGTYKQFDNNDTKVFGNINWREAYPNWEPQKTQTDALRVSSNGDKTKIGQRKSYESLFMRNPLAGATIVALAADSANRASIEAVIRHYDYSKLNMSEFFFAECAYYALPEAK